MNIKKKCQNKFDTLRELCEDGDGIFCDSMNCMCGVDLLRWFFLEHITSQFCGMPMFFVTICLDRDVVPAGELNEIDLKNSIRSLKGLLKEAKLREFKAVGFVDIQRTEIIETKECLWHFHYHLIAVSAESERQFRKKLGSSIPQSMFTKKPCKVKRVTKTPEHAVDYILKYEHALKKKLRTLERQLKKSYPIIRQARKELDLFLLDTPPFQRIVHIDSSLL